MAKQKQSGSKTSPHDEQLDFESALKEVESIVEKLESGEPGLTESLEHYEIGIKRLKQCHALLEAAERKITLLSGFDADGNPVTEAFEGDADESLTDKQKARTGRRSRRSGTKSLKKPATGADEDSSVDGPPGLF